MLAGYAERLKSAGFVRVRRADGECVAGAGVLVTKQGLRLTGAGSPIPFREVAGGVMAGLWLTARTASAAPLFFGPVTGGVAGYAVDLRRGGRGGRWTYWNVQR